MATVTGTSGNDFIHVAGDGLVPPAGYLDTPLATDSNDVIKPTGGNDIVFAGGGDDTMNFAAKFTAADQIDGQAGSDRLLLTGDYSGVQGVLFAATTMVGVEKIQLTDGFEYDLTTHDATVAAGEMLTVDALALTGAAQLVFDGSAELDGRFTIFGGDGTDYMKGGAKADVFGMTLGGTDGAYGGGGADTFLVGATLTAADTIDGGAGSDTVILNGDYSGPNTLGLGSGTIKNVEILQLTAGHAYTINFGTDDIIAAGKSLLIDGSTLGATDTMSVNDLVETDGLISIKGGAADDSFSLNRPFTVTSAIDGGAGNDTVYTNGDYSAGFAFTDTTMTSVEKLNIGGAGPQSFTLAEGTIAAGQTLFITRYAGTTADSVSIDASADSDGNINFAGNVGDDYVFATAGNDYFTGGGGHDEIYGLWGDDYFEFLGTFDALDKLDGGALDDTLHLQGDYSAGIVFNDTTIKNIELIDLVGGNSYKFTSANGNVASNATLTVDGTGMFGANVLTFDGSAETDGHFKLIGGAGNDVLTGGSQSDTFVLNLGGDDIVKGGDGNDLFSFVNSGGGLTGADQLDGGAGNDTLELIGISSPVVFTATTMVNVETLKIDPGAFPITLTTADATIAAGKTLTITYDSSNTSDFLNLDGTAETDGKFSVLGAAGDDNIQTGAGDDSMNMSRGGNDVVHAGGGNDTLNFGFAYTSSDIVDGGSGTDTFGLSGNYTLTFGASAFSSIEILSLTGRSGVGHYTLTMNDGNVASGQQLKVDASNALSLNLNASAETNGRYVVVGSAGNDTITTTLNNDSLFGGLGHDDLSSKGGNDVFVYTSVSESTGQTRDLLRDFIASSDKFDLNVAVTGVDAKITSGAMNEASFTTDLAAAVNGSNLAAHHAVMFVASSGGLMNHAFLVVDANGTAGFQAGADYVMEINNPGIVGTFTTANFI